MAFDILAFFFYGFLVIIGDKDLSVGVEEVWGAGDIIPVSAETILFNNAVPQKCKPTTVCRFGRSLI